MVRSSDDVQIGSASLSIENGENGESTPSSPSTKPSKKRNGSEPPSIAVLSPKNSRRIDSPRSRRERVETLPSPHASPSGASPSDGWQVQRWDQVEDWRMGDNHLVISQESMELLLNVGRLIQREQDSKMELHTMHIKTVSLIVLATVAIGMSMVWLRVVLIPFILAVFFMFLLEPLLFTIMNPNSAFKRCSKRAAQRAEQSEQERLRYFTSSPTEQSKRPAPSLDDADDDERVVGCQEKTGTILKQMSWKAWGVFSVACCIIVLLAGIVGILYFVVKSIENFPWEKYQKSPKLRMLVEWIPNLGADPENLDFSALIPWMMQGPLVEAIGITFSILSTALLMLLFLAFLLINDLASGEDDSVLGLRKKLRLSVRKYIIIKSAISLMVAFVIGLVLMYFEVDLWFVFAVLTLILNYIPHVGSTIAIIAPLPLVWLDPTKSVTDLVNVLIIPLVIHQVVGNVIEPKLLSVSLELHPIVVILSLAFWTTIWGAIGAVLSVPLTAVLRLVLKDFSHPYILPIVCLLEGKWDGQPSQAQRQKRRHVLVSNRDDYSSHAQYRSPDPTSPIVIDDTSPRSQEKKRESRRAAYMRPGLAKRGEKNHRQHSREKLGDHNFQSNGSNGAQPKANTRSHSSPAQIHEAAGKKADIPQLPLMPRSNAGGEQVPKMTHLQL